MGRFFFSLGRIRILRDIVCIEKTLFGLWSKKFRRVRKHVVDEHSFGLKF